MATKKYSRYEIVWNNFPEYLYKNSYVLAKISYEQNDGELMQNCTELLIIQLIDELKF